MSSFVDEGSEPPLCSTGMWERYNWLLFKYDERDSTRVKMPFYN